MFNYPDGMKIDQENSRASARLVRVYEKSDGKFGSVLLHREIGIADAAGTLGPGFRPGQAGKYICDLTIEVCIDGSVPGWKHSGIVTGNLVLVLPDGSGEIRLREEGRVEESAELDRPASH
jgi:hypothetical protein